MKRRAPFSDTGFEVGLFMAAQIGKPITGHEVGNRRIISAK